MLTGLCRAVTGLGLWASCSFFNHTQSSFIHFSGEKFQMKVEKMRFAQQLSELVKSVTDVGQDDACS